MRYWFLLFLSGGLLASCQSSRNEAQAQQEALQALEMQLLTAQDVNVDPEVAQAFLEKSQAYVQAFPKDSLAPSYLFKAAEVSRGLRQFGDAIKLAGQVWREYPEFEKAPDAVFLQGFIYDTDLDDTLNARKYYERFLEKYPEHPFAVNVIELLSVLGKDPEALIREFQAKDQAKRD
ncbi:MAG: tetratricopeptide repeat protein [Saprospirales bacterium]|nr:tetratricopeptide repeat protein [Saprospirales bacterium]MBK8489807.1 tetratricopeptide repeat protein [Saprospirales bacterium]